MAKLQTIKFSEFMSGEYKTKKSNSKLIKSKKTVKGITKKVALSSTIPLIFTPHVFAETTQSVAGSGVTSYIGEKSLEVIAHALDPLVELMVALSFPIASVIMVGACFFFMFNNAEKAWGMIMRAGLGYVLIQLSPLFLKILKEVGNAI